MQANVTFVSYGYRTRSLVLTYLIPEKSMLRGICVVQKGVLHSKNGVMSIICRNSSGNKLENLCGGGRIILKWKLKIGWEGVEWIY